MTQQQYIIKRKLNIPELSEQLGNVSEACRRLGVSIAACVAFMSI